MVRLQQMETCHVQPAINSTSKYIVIKMYRCIVRGAPCAIALNEFINISVRIVCSKNQQDKIITNIGEVISIALKSTRFYDQVLMIHVWGGWLKAGTWCQCRVRTNEAAYIKLELPIQTR